MGGGDFPHGGWGKGTFPILEPTDSRLSVFEFLMELDCKFAWMKSWNFAMFKTPFGWQRGYLHIILVR
jgi:hypothetical protein